VKIQDKRGAELLQEAMKAHQAGRFAEAQTLYERALARWPGDPDALHFFGVLRHNQKQSPAGIELVQRSLQSAPGNAHAWLNLGNIFLETDQIEQAKAAYERASVLAPELADVWFNLGVCLRKLNDARAAVDKLDRALALRPDHAATLYQRGIARREAGDAQAAESDFRAVLRLKPDYAEVNESLGMLLYRQGRFADASLVYSAWLAQDPHSSTARHMAAAMSGQDTPRRASDEYVTETFNRFAATFDANLAQLGYRAPELVAGALTHAAGPGRTLTSVLDAGCGTGLCGVLLRPTAKRLVGVDLSPAMLEAARAKNCYDELEEGELCAFMRQRSAAFDAIVAADTFNYFGALEEVLFAAAASLKPDGLLVMTLEKSITDAAQNYRIEPHGRYTHGQEYARAALKEAKFDLMSAEEQVLRRERGEDVRGLVLTARRANTPGMR
jgi:predicted TPR repeat methyltransferase